jgi:hypothetical protein
MDASQKKSLLRPDESLEEALGAGDIKPEKVVKALQKHSGLLNLIRNLRNQKQKAVEDILK